MQRQSETRATHQAQVLGVNSDARLGVPQQGRHMSVAVVGSLPVPAGVCVLSMAMAVALFELPYVNVVPREVVFALPMHFACHPLPFVPATSQVIGQPRSLCCRSQLTVADTPRGLGGVSLDLLSTGSKFAGANAMTPAFRICSAGVYTRSACSGGTRTRMSLVR